MRLNKPQLPRIALALLTVLLIASACGTEEELVTDAAYTVLAEPSLVAGDAVPVPKGDVVLTISGDIGNTNVGETLQFDMATLESLGLVEYSVDDYQAEGRVAMFGGVLASDVLDVAAAGEGATTLKTIALNDYEVEIPVIDIADFPVIIATTVDGDRMPVESYGPTRVIYPSSSYEFDESVYGPRWIWQLAEIEVN